MIRQIELYRIVATGPDVVMNTITVTSTGTTIYFNHRLIGENRTHIYNSLLSGDIIALKVDGVTEMNVIDALTDLSYVGDMADVNNLNSYTNQVIWNLEISNQLIASVRGEMLNTSISQLG